MNNIPLISKVDTQDINTSLIAIKKAQQQLNDLINTADGKIKELNSLIASLNLGNLGGSGKYIQSIEQIKGQVSVTVGELTDTISSGNNQPATSQGVANALSGKVNTDTYTDTNLNTLINTGFYIVRYVNQTWDNLNYPVQHCGTVLVGTTASGNLMQMFMSDDEQLVYVRNCTVNIWSNWKRILNNYDITDAVVLNDLRSVTSNAVATALADKANGNIFVGFIYFTPRQLNTPSEITSIVSTKPAGIYVFVVGWEEYQTFQYAGTHGYIIVTGGSAYAYGKIRNYANPNYIASFWWVDAVVTDRFSGIQAV